MRLKSLEIKGFKSFPNETVLHFNADVTGVVGPNGSGKSNVVDAIRWVLGEQKSRELRLDKMSSVIFNGTKKRKEGQMAQVRDPHGIENPIQVVDLVLEHTGKETLRLAGDRTPVAVEPAIADPPMPGHQPTQMGDRQAALERQVELGPDRL